MNDAGAQAVLRGRRMGTVSKLRSGMRRCRGHVQEIQERWRSIRRGWMRVNRNIFPQKTDLMELSLW